MRRRSHPTSNLPTPYNGATGEVELLPTLATAEQIAHVLQVSARTVHLWAAAGTIPVALRQGKVVRFHPPAVAESLGLDLPEFGTNGARIESPASPEVPDSFRS